MAVRRSILQIRAAARREQRYEFYNTPAWRACRDYVQRDAYTCTLCGQPGDQCDHYPIPLRKIIEAGADPCNPADCRILCRRCHGKVDGAGGY
jgi:5-methylcytosine-specific restriction endonuclease McrA